MMAAFSLKKFAYSWTPAVAHPFMKRLEASDTGSRLARGVFWSFTGTVISRGLMLCAAILVARILGKTGYGELGIIQSTVAMFGVFAGFGLGMTATKHVAEYRRNDPQRAGRIIGIAGLFAVFTGGLMALALFVFAPWLAKNTINAPHLVGILRIGALILFINALNGAQTGALSGFEAFKTIAKVNLLAGLLSFPILVFGAWFGGLNGAVWALAINLGLSWLLNHVALRREAHLHQVPFTLRGCTQEWPVIWRFSLPAAIASAMVGPVNWICNAMLVNQPNGYDEMGIYNAANQWFAMLMFLPGILGSVVLPLLSNQMGENNTFQSKRTLTLAIKVNFLIVFPLVLIFGIGSPYIMGLYGEGFSSGWVTLIFVIITAGIVAVNAPVGQLIAASGKMWIGMYMNFGWAIVFIAANYLLVKYGAMGVSTARLLAYLCHTIWVFLFIFKLLKEKHNNI